VRNRTWVRKQEGLTLFLPTAALSVVLVIRLGVSNLTRRRKAHTCVIIPVSREHLKTHKRHNRKLTNLKGSPTKMISLLLTILDFFTAPMTVMGFRPGE
jgi:hypothetical protein